MPKVKVMKEHVSGQYVEVQINVDPKTGEFYANLPKFMQDVEEYQKRMVGKSLPDLEQSIRFKVKEFLAEAESIEFFIRVQFAVSGHFKNGGQFDKDGFSDYHDYIKFVTSIIAKEVNSVSKRVVWYEAKIGADEELRKTYRMNDVWKEVPSGTIIKWHPVAYSKLKSAEDLMRRASEQITGVLTQEPDKIIQTLLATKSLGAGE